MMSVTFVLARLAPPLGRDNCPSFSSADLIIDHAVVRFTPDALPDQNDLRLYCKHRIGAACRLL